MPVYKGVDTDTFKAAFDSLLAQTRMPEELIIVLDGPVLSSIRTYIEEKKGMLKVEVIELPENLGTGIASQEGLNHCTGDWIARVDADDISFDSRFETMEKYIMNNPEISICGSLIAEVPDLFEKNRVSFIRNVPIDHESIVHYGNFRYPFNNPTLFVKRNMVLEAGGYRDVKGYEDWDLALRVFRINGRAGNINKVLAKVHQNYSRRKGWEIFKNDFNALRRFRKEGYHSQLVFLFNIFVRLATRIFPFLTPTLYRLALRTKRKSM